MGEIFELTYVNIHSMKKNVGEVSNLIARH